MSDTPALPKITEFPLSEEDADSVAVVVDGAADFLKIDLSQASPKEIIATLDQYVHDLQQGRVEGPEGEDSEIFFGCLWGAQLVRQLGWEWANVTFHDYNDAHAIGVFSPDRSLAIYPFHFIFGCLENKAPVTILLSFNLLEDGTRIPELPARSYTNVMDHVHHIVPRE
jgi:hypothetical protein